MNVKLSRLAMLVLTSYLCACSQQQAEQHQSPIQAQPQPAASAVAAATTMASAATSVASAAMASSVALSASAASSTTPAVSASPAVAPLPKTAQQKEHYIVGTDIGYPPFDFRDENGKIVGFDVDVLTAIAKNQNFTVEFLFTKRSQLFPNLQADEYQILAACLGYRPERLAISEMSDPYAYAPNVIMGKEGSNAKVLYDLRNNLVATQDASHSHDSLKQAGVTQIAKDASLYGAYSKFARGEADYVVGDAGVLSYFHSTNKDKNKPKVYTSIYAPKEDVRVAFAVKKGNHELINKINQGLRNIKANGTYDKIYTRWFGKDNSLRVPEKFVSKKK